MPLYEYQCEACGARFERIRKFSDPPLEEPCPTCGGRVEKLISSPAIQFKGKGWYVTDYAKSGSEAKTASEGGADSKKKDSTEGKSEGSSAGTESKPEPKSESKPASAAPAAPRPKSD